MSASLRFSVTILLLTLVGPLASLSAAPMRHDQELRIHLGVGGGAHDPDLEEKFYNDRLYGSLLAGGVGFDSEWEQKAAAGSDFQIDYYNGPWRFLLESVAAVSQPEYIGFSTIRSGTVGFTEIDFRQADSLTRNNARLLGGYDVSESLDLGGAHQLYALFGLGTLAQRAEFTGLTLQTASVGTLSGSAVGLPLEDSADSFAAGFSFGADYRYAWSDSLQLQARWLLEPMGGGSWEFQRTRIFTSGVLTYRNEEGDLEAFRSSLYLGLNWAFAEDWLFTAGMTIEGTRIKDKNVVPIAFTSGVPFDASAFLLDYALTYPGSANDDGIFLMTFGVTYRFNLSD